MPEAPPGSPSEPAAAADAATPGLADRVAWLFVVGGGFVVQGLLTISGILSARLLGVEGRGELALVVAVSTMAAQLTLGGSLPNAVVARLAGRGLRARDALGHLVGRWVLIGVVVALPFAVLYALLHGDVRAQHVWLLAGATAVLAVQNMAFRLVTSALLGERASMVRIALATLLPQTLVTTGVLVLFVTLDRTSPTVICAVMVVAFALGLGVSLPLLAPRSDDGERLESADLWALSRSTYLGSVGPIDGLSLDRTLVGALLGTTTLGLYTAAAALASLMGMLGTGLAAVMLPQVAHAQGDPALERATVRRWLLLGTGVIAALALVATLLAGPLIRLAFGEAFAPAVPVAHWLVPAAALLGLRRLLIAVLQGRERGGVASWVELALTPVLVAGIVAAALADQVVAVGMAMLAVGAVAVALLGVAVLRSAPAHGRH